MTQPCSEPVQHGEMDCRFDWLTRGLVFKTASFFFHLAVRRMELEVIAAICSISK